MENINRKILFEYFQKGVSHENFNPTRNIFRGDVYSSSNGSSPSGSADNVSSKSRQVSSRFVQTTAAKSLGQQISQTQAQKSRSFSQMVIADEKIFSRDSSSKFSIHAGIFDSRRRKKSSRPCRAQTKQI